jgi:CRISPR-associated protein Cas1
MSGFRWEQDLPDPRPRHVIEGRPRWSRSRTGDYFDRLVRMEALESGWRRVWRNRGAPGEDGVTVADFAARATEELDILRAELIAVAYRPGPLRAVPIPKKNGGRRWLRIPCVRDRVVQAAAHDLLSQGLEPELEPWSFAYRRGRSVDQAVALARRWLESGFEHVIDADIESFFDSVSHDRVRHKLVRATADEDLAQLVEFWLAATDGVEPGEDHGLPQGAPISPVLANLFLDDLDEAFCGRHVRMVRFADDFLIFLRSHEAAHVALGRLAKLLEGDGLRLHPDKTRLLGPGRAIPFLGQVIARAVQEPEREALELLADEEPGHRVGDALHDAGPDIDAAPGIRPLYLREPGRVLSRANQSFSVLEEGREAARIHHSRVDRIEIGPRGGIDVDAIRLAAETGTALAFVNGAGLAEAHLVGRQDRWAARHLAQARMALDPARALEMARELIRAQVAGRKQILYDIHHMRKRRGDLAEDGRSEWKIAARQLQRQLNALAKADSIEAVRTVEAMAAQIYWPVYGTGFLHGFWLGERERRKGQNPIPLLLDFAAALLLRDMQAAVLKAGLHPGFGVLHVTQDVGMALVWDLVEPFRAPLAEASVREAINTPDLGDADFERRAGRLRLRATGANAFIRVYERVAARVSIDPRSGEQVGWREKMRRDARAWVRAAEEGAPFVASEKR